MKTKQFVLALLSLVLTISTGATKIPKMNILALDDSKALISAETDPTVSSEILIEAENGQTVYYKMSKASNVFKSIFDLSNLKDGTYTVKITTGAVSAKRSVEVRNGEFAVNDIKIQVEPYFTCDGNLLKVSYLNFDEDNVSLLIYNGSQLVFQSDLGQEFNIQKGFDISHMVTGNYSVVLAGTGEDYNYRINR